MQELQGIIDTINRAFDVKSQVRDRTLTRSRELIRHWEYERWLMTAGAPTLVGQRFGR